MNRTQSDCPRKPSASARAEAAVWIARLHGPQRSPELEAGLRRWLAEHADNARAFERMTEAWERATIVSTPGHFPRLVTWRPGPSPMWVRAAGIVLACGGATLAAYLWWNEPTYATDIGEQRMVRLEDGSRLSLNSASRVAVDYRASARRVRLEKGEAFFEVVSDPSRPFVVVAGEREITALGTSFSVRYEAAQLAVMLVEGKVTVSMVNAHDPAVLEAPAPPPVVLAPGQRLVMTPAAPPQLDTPRVDAVTAWRRGELVLDRTRLVDAVAEMNRYDERRLVVGDARIASLLVSGIYRTGDSAGFARAVGKMYDLTVLEEGDRILLEVKAPRAE